MLLPGDLEVDLYRISNGEPIRWHGLSSGVVEKSQGAAIMTVAAGIALLTLPQALQVVFDIMRLLDPKEGGQGVGGFGVVTGGAFLMGLGAFGLGWRMFQSANRVVFAVTSKRLIRMVGGQSDRARFWGKSDVVKVERLKWSTRKIEGLAVTVRNKNRRSHEESTLIIIGPPDLGAAEHALAALED